MSTSYSLLPREVTALISHVELNQAGWWDKTLQRLVLATVWLMEESPDRAKISRMLKESWNLTVSPEKLESVLNSLMDEDSLIKVSNDVYRIPEEKRKIFERDIKAAEKAESDAREYFCSLVEDSCPDLDGQEVWKDFEHILFIPMVRDFGASTYRLIAGERIAPDESYTEHFLKKFGPGYRGALKAVVANFLDPKREDVRDYAMRLLYAHFCVEASGLSGEVLEKLKSITNKQAKFSLFVDTNFLFSFLGLHENPSNASATELKELLYTLKSKLRIDLRITPGTIEEAKKVIYAAKQQVCSIPITNNFSGAVLRIGMSGLSARFFSERKKRKGQLTAEDWFDPYINNFAQMANATGVELFNEKFDEYSARPDVIDDIVSITEHEEKTLPTERRKSYEKVAHDAILWHLVKDRRTAYVESPLDAQEWILTVDFRLIGFDEYKRKNSRSNIPLCLHPTSLIQLLQFWVPRTQKFEEAVIGSLRLPLLFQEFDAQAERISLNIINRLGRFEGSENIPQETLVNVVMNDGLRSRISTEQLEEKATELVRDTLLAEEQNRMQAIKLKVEELESIVEGKSTALAKLEEREKEKNEKIQELQENLRQEKEKSQNLDNQFTQLDKDITVLKKNFALAGYIFFLVSMSGLSILAVWQIDPTYLGVQGTLGIILTKLAIATLVFVVFHWLFEFIVRRHQQVQQLQFFRKVRNFKKWLLGVSVALTITVVGNLLTDIFWGI